MVPLAAAVPSFLGKTTAPTLGRRHKARAVKGPATYFYAFATLDAVPRKATKKVTTKPLWEVHKGQGKCNRYKAPKMGRDKKKENE